MGGGLIERPLGLRERRRQRCALLLERGKLLAANQQCFFAALEVATANEAAVDDSPDLGELIFSDDNQPLLG